MLASQPDWRAGASDFDLGNTLVSRVAERVLAISSSRIPRYGRGAGVGRSRGVGAVLGVGDGLAVAVGVAVAVAVGVAVAAGVAVEVGVGPDCAQYLSPVLK